MPPWQIRSADIGISDDSLSTFVDSPNIGTKPDSEIKKSRKDRSHFFETTNLTHKQCSMQFGFFLSSQTRFFKTPQFLYSIKNYRRHKSKTHPISPDPVRSIRSCGLRNARTQSIPVHEFRALNHREIQYSSSQKNHSQRHGLVS